jgi:hypothetical protein
MKVNTSGTFESEGHHSPKRCPLVVILYHDQDDNPVLGFDYDDHHNHSPLVHSNHLQVGVDLIRLGNGFAPIWSYCSQDFPIQNIRDLSALRRYSDWAVGLQN